MNILLYSSLVTMLRFLVFIIIMLKFAALSKSSPVFVEKITEEKKFPVILVHYY